MTQTIGYWCDECRIKYVQHMCGDGLPCGHDKARAIRVYAKSYGKGGERVIMKWSGGHISVWLLEKWAKSKVVYCGSLARFLHGYTAETENGTMTLMDWLREQEEKVVRAFLERWDSHKYPPDWRMIMLANAGDETKGEQDDD